jgi:hypothetical protein
MRHKIKFSALIGFAHSVKDGTQNFNYRVVIGSVYALYVLFSWDSKAKRCQT